MTKPEMMQCLFAAMLETYTRKNHDYGDSFAESRREIPFYTLSKLTDKYYRYKTLQLSGNAVVQDEAITDTLLDMANYCVMELMELALEKQEKAPEE